MFDFERAAGQAFIKDERLKSYQWTETGIKLKIPHISKDTDVGKYEGEVDTGSDFKGKSIKVEPIFGQSFIYYNCFLYYRYKIFYFWFVCLNNTQVSEAKTIATKHRCTILKSETRRKTS